MGVHVREGGREGGREGEKWCMLVNCNSKN